MPTIEAIIDLSRGERFVRYWTTVWANSGGTQRLYCLGIERQGQHAMLCYYPRHNKMVLAAKRPFDPPWTPRPFDLLPGNARFIGGPGEQQFGWLHESFGGLVRIFPGNRLELRAIYG
jgi:hypothetical protein